MNDDHNDDHSKEPKSKYYFPTQEEIEIAKERTRQGLIRSAVMSIANDVEMNLRNNATSVYGNLPKAIVKYERGTGTLTEVITIINEIQDYGVCFPFLDKFSNYPINNWITQWDEKRHYWNFVIIDEKNAYAHQRRWLIEHGRKNHELIFATLFGKIRQKHVAEGRDHYCLLDQAPSVHKDGYEAIIMTTQELFGKCKFVFRSIYPEEDITNVSFTVNLLLPDDSLWSEQPYKITDPNGDWLDIVLALWKDPIERSRTKVRATSENQPMQTQQSKNEDIKSWWRRAYRFVLDKIRSLR